VLAYIMAKTDVGKEVEVLNQLKTIPGWKRASCTYGIYDLCIESEIGTMEELDQLVFDQIRKIPGVKETVTLVTSRSIANE
jgi:DNA-binding Lrp family transcriptional regulator